MSTGERVEEQLLGAQDGRMIDSDWNLVIGLWRMGGGVALIIEPPTTWSRRWSSERCGTEE